MKIRRRTFLKTGGSLVAALLASPGHSYPAGKPVPRVRFGREIPGRCPLCSVGCGVIYRSTGFNRWVVEGDPECPTANGSLCTAGASLAAMNRIPRTGPRYRAPGGSEWEDIGWAEAVEILARRLKDVRDRDLSYNASIKKSTLNSVNSLGILAGSFLTNEEAYTMVKLFRCLGVLRMDTTVRASHGIGILGLMETLGFPGATHPVSQIAYSDVVLLMGSNPGQTAPAVCRLLDKVRERRGTVIVIDTRKTETVKEGDLFLQVRPGTDAAVLGAFMKWLLDRGNLDISGIVKHSDAPFIILSQVTGEYERHRSGKNKNQLMVDETLMEPYSVFQRLKDHFQRYDLRKTAVITGLDIELLRRACTLIARTASPQFSASFVLGSGMLGHHSGINAVRMAAMIQVLLGNLDKRGGGIILPSCEGNAQGVCDMGLLAPFFPGYLDLTEGGQKGMKEEDRNAIQALCRAWYPGADLERAIGFLPHRQVTERHSLSTIIQGVDDGDVRALITVGADPMNSLPGSASLPESLKGLDLLIVMDHVPGETGEFWKMRSVKEESIKTEVLFIPIEMPIFQDGSMTDSGRRARTVHPIPSRAGAPPGLLDFLVKLGNALKSKYLAEGGPLEDAILEMNWPLFQDSGSVAAEINGWRKEGPEHGSLIPENGAWEQGDRCGNRLYRGWITSERWLADRRDPSDPYNIALFNRWGWFWPGGVPDPYSWIKEPGKREGVYLRWAGQTGERHSAADILPSGILPPVRFWMAGDTATPFPEHYEPFYSPLHDMLTGGRSSPYLSVRVREKGDWDYLFRSPEKLLDDYPVIMTSHRTGNTVGTGRITAMVPHLRELGACRIVEIGIELADSLGVRSGEVVAISSPFWEDGVNAVALVTGRMGSFQRGHARYHVASVTRYGEGDRGINVLTTPAFNTLSGGLESRTFMGKIKKVQSSE